MLLTAHALRRARAVPLAWTPIIAPVSRGVRETIRNPFNWVCNCDPSCWCSKTRWGYWLMYYVPPRFHRFPPKQ